MKSIFCHIIVCVLLFGKLLYGGTNLLPRDFSQWTAIHGATYVAQSGHALEDVLQIKHSKPESEEQLWLSPMVSIQDSARILRLSAWMKCSCVALDGLKQRSDPTYNASLCIRFFDKDGRDVEPEKPILSVHHSIRRTWQFLEEQVIVPKSAAALQVKFCFRRHALGIAWAGDICLEKMAASSLLVDKTNTMDKQPLLHGPNASGLVPFYLDSEKFSQIFEPGQDISFKVKYRSILKKQKNEIPADSVLRYVVRDIDGLVIEQGEMPLTISDKDVLRLKHSEKINSGVYHELHAQIYHDDVFWAEDTISFGVIPTRKFDPASEPEIFELDGLDELAIRMGVRRRYLIGGNPANWQLKKAAELKKKYGVKFYTNGLIVATSWQKKNLPARRNSFFKSDEAAFREDLHKQLLRYKGIIDGVGLMGEMLPPKVGEPNAEKQALEQVEVMRILKEEIQKVEPSMQAAAGGYFYPDFDLLLQKGMAKYADLIMLHRFSDPAVTEVDLAKTRRVLNMLSGHKPEIWVDEAYCFGNAEEQVHQQYVNYLAYGVKIGDWHLYNFKYKEYWKTKALSIYYPVKNNITLPEPALFSYNVMIGQLSGLEFIEKNKSLEKDGISCYIFRVKETGKYRLAIWTRSDVKQRILQVQTTGSALLSDIRGRQIPLKSANGTIAVGITPRPQYLELDNPNAVLSCVADMTFTSSVDVVRELKTSVRLSIPENLRCNKILSLILPDGWSANTVDTTAIELRSPTTVQVNKTCFGYIVLKDAREEQGCAIFPIQLNVIPPLQIEITPRFTKNGRQIQVQLTNSGSDRNAVITLVNGFTRESRPQIVKKEMMLKGKGEKTLLNYIAEAGTPTDEEPVDVTVADTSGNILGEKKSMLSFFGVPHTRRPHAFEGKAHDTFWETVPVLNMNSELWLDANEMYSIGSVFATPEQNDGTWKGANDFAVQLQQCWDEEHYYIRAVVKDAQHINDFRDLMIWSGDAIQLRIADATNQGAFSSFCIALNTDKQAQIWRYRGNEFNAAGNVRTIPCRIERDEHNQRTIYELVFPKNEIEPTTLKAGNNLKISFVFLNRINRLGKNPMAIRLGYGIYDGGGSGDAIVTLMENRYPTLQSEWWM